MITVVVSGYGVLMLTIVFALFGVARRPQPKPTAGLELSDMPVRRNVRPVQQPVASTVRGGSEVFAIGA